MKLTKPYSQTFTQLCRNFTLSDPKSTKVTHMNHHYVHPSPSMQLHPSYLPTGEHGFGMGYGVKGYGGGKRTCNNTCECHVQAPGFGKSCINDPNPFKCVNNGKYCFGCGFDTDHKGHNCPLEIYRSNHNPK